MFVSKKKYKELEDRYYRLVEKEEIIRTCVTDLEIKYKEFGKIANNEYGDSLVFLKHKWAGIAWLEEIKPESGEELLKIISEDVKILIASLIKKKKK